MRLEELEAAMPGVRRLWGSGADITGIAYHSSRVTPGGLFAAVPGFVTDGHRFIGEALERGARALLLQDPGRLPEGVPEDVAVLQAEDVRAALALASDRFFGHPSGRMKLVGVTGTNGKTTTAFLLESIFREAGMGAGLLGTVSYRVNGREMPVSRTTPEAPDLQCMLARMADEGVEAAAMEVSSHALDLHRVDGCEFAAAVFTNLSQDHLDWHGNMESYYLSKRRLFLPPAGSGLTTGAAAVNLDDPYGRRLQEEMGGKAFTYGAKGRCDLTGRILELGLKGIRVEMAHEGRKVDFRAGLAGAFNLYNMLAAASAALLLGLDLEEAVEGIRACPGVPGRFQLVEEGQDFAVVVDYAHTPDSLAQAIRAAREVSRGRVITVFGCGGDRDRAKRPLMGRHAAELSDHTLVTSDNPRSEDPLAIMAEIEAGIREAKEGASYESVEDRREAIRRALRMAGPGDVVLIAGKGHEQGQVFADRTVPFDDYQVASEILRELGG